VVLFVIDKGVLKVAVAGETLEPKSEQRLVAIVDAPVEAPPGPRPARA
jgi:hypothetical protein